jgi:P-type E1-E2 ATPase
MAVPIAEIAPGDVILLTAGTKVPADASLIEVANLEVEEAMLTGESLSVRKTVEPLSVHRDWNFHFAADRGCVCASHADGVGHRPAGTG